MKKYKIFFICLPVFLMFHVICFATGTNTGITNKNNLNNIATNSDLAKKENKKEGNINDSKENVILNRWTNDYQKIMVKKAIKSDGNDDKKNEQKDILKNNYNNSAKDKNDFSSKNNVSQANNDAKVAVKDIKIDDKMIAKVIVSSKKADNIYINADIAGNDINNNYNILNKNNNSLHKNVNNNTTSGNENSLNSEKSNKNNFTYQSTINGDQQNIVISGKYDVNSTKDTHVITLKSGIKSVNVSFKPEIDVDCTGGNAGFAETTACAKNNKFERKNNNSVSVYRVSQKKNVNTCKKKTNKYVGNGNKGKLYNKNNKQVGAFKASRFVSQKTRTSSPANVVAMVEKQNTKNNGINKNDNNAVKMVNEVYPLNGVSNKPMNGGKNDEPVKIIEKQVVNTPVYVINRIIGVDEDMVLTQDTIDKIATDNNSNVAVYGEEKPKKKDSFKTAYLGGSEVNFINQYGIIESDDLKYGEVAFIDDYND